MEGSTLSLKKKLQVFFFFFFLKGGLSTGFTVMIKIDSRQY